EGLADRGEIFVDPPAYSIANPVTPAVANLSLVLPLAHATRYRGRLDAFFDERVRQVRHLAARFPGLSREAPVHALGPLAYRAARLFERRAGLLDLLMGVIGDFVPPRALMHPRTLAALLRPS